MKNNGLIHDYPSLIGGIGNRKKNNLPDFEWDSSKLKKVTWLTRLSAYVWLVFHSKKQ